MSKRNYYVGNTEVNVERKEVLENALNTVFNCGLNTYHIWCEKSFVIGGQRYAMS